MNEWNIQSRAHGCQACGKPFADPQTYHTLLFDEKDDFKRLDVCDPCWQAQYIHGASDRKGFVSYWQGVYEAPPAAASDPIRKENAESLLRKVIELDDPKQAAVAYILAALLEQGLDPAASPGAEPAAATAVGAERPAIASESPLPVVAE